MRNLYYFVMFLSFISCESSSKTGIEGNNNSNNTVIIADRLNIPDEESLKYKLNFDITPEGVGGIKIDQSIVEVQKFFKYNPGYIFETDEGQRDGATDFDLPTIYVKNIENDLLFSIILGNNKFVSGFEVFSEKYTTYNGIHVGMSVRELSKIYVDKLILHEDMLGDGGYFEPFDLQGDKVYVGIHPKSDKPEYLLLNNKEYGTEANYSLEGEISLIDVNKYN